VEGIDTSSRKRRAASRAARLRWAIETAQVEIQRFQQGLAKSEEIPPSALRKLKLTPPQRQWRNVLGSTGLVSQVLNQHQWLESAWEKHGWPDVIRALRRWRHRVPRGSRQPWRDPAQGLLREFLRERLYRRFQCNIEKCRPEPPHWFTAFCGRPPEPCWDTGANAKSSQIGFPYGEARVGRSLA
jgi:hypothetical protein